MIGHGVSVEALQGWGKLTIEREAAPLPLYAPSPLTSARESMLVGKADRLSLVGGIRPHTHGTTKTGEDGDDEPDDLQEDGTALDGWSWTQSSSW